MKDNITMLHGGYHSRKPPARITARDRMQSSLLDRLTDNEPDKEKEAASNYLLSHRTFRQNVLRDLQWLLNSINNESNQELSSFAEIQHSTYNFGIAPLAGKNMSDIEWNDIKNKIIKAIHIFEPRIIPNELQVNCISNINSLSLYNILSIEIKGVLWCIPWPIEFLFRSDIDLEHCYFTMEEAS
ncbi:type VI secretion system baseplate subunit TssE [Xenorhabdus sp. XENO-10]|uniref:Type VI secretion system baseplate subunit TssE n=1 Tax=Xenorhabdus yunnanensis TaxID=3025878 RepID=A0ABT5LGM7_9GAMM|nr:type VI secretion system baseplate subunit TssE [Xenorhabdus yunnanensis]MDC9590239.1 type VI secretion system baseplate subunit TssE [Xenorhabdus yunnanensis]